MKVLVACEESQEVCKAFRALGHEAYSCDTQSCSGGHPEWHIVGDAITASFSSKWNLIIVHPPCTYLTVSNNSAMANGCKKYTAIQGQKLRQSAIDFFMQFANHPFIEMYGTKIAIENPIGIMSTRYRKPNQIIQPWQFGNSESKATCLWLNGLQNLKPTNVLPIPRCGHWDNQTPSRQNKLGPSENRTKLRSKTYPGIASAMAEQWGGKII